MPTPDRTVDRIAIDLTIRILLLIAVIWVVMTLLKPFATIFIWSIVLTAALYPVFFWLRTRMGGRGVPAALLVTALSLALILGPIAMLTTSMIETSLRAAAAWRLHSLDIDGLVRQLGSMPVVGSMIQEQWSTATSDTRAFVLHYAHMMVVPSEAVLKFTAHISADTLAFAAAVVLTGFLFIPAPRMSQAASDLANRVVGPRGNDFVRLAIDTTRSVSRGIVGVAVLQSLLFGIILMVAKVPHPGLITMVMLIMIIVQIGTGIVILPLLVWMFFTRDLTAVIFFGIAVLPVAALEHVLKPLALAKGLTTPMPVIVVGVLGGMIAYGLPGLFIGPIVLAVGYELVVFWVWPERHLSGGETDLPDQVQPPTD